VREKGFTLLEVLLAIAVLGVVVTMIALTFSGSLKVVNATEQQEETYHQVQTTLRRITDDLAAAVLSQDVAFTGLKKEVDGRRADTLVFASQAHLVFNPEKQKQGVAVIRYQLRPDAEDGRRSKLLRSDTLLLPGVTSNKEDTEDSPFLLADNLRSVRFIFADRQGQEFDSWDEAMDINEPKAPPLPATKGPQKAPPLPATSEPQKARPLPAAVYCILEFWLDPDKDTVQTFRSGVLIPTATIMAEVKSAK